MPVVWLVEDNDGVREAIEAMLEMYGATVRSFADGAEVLEALPAGEKPDLLLTDLDMPKVGGEELIRRLLLSPEWREGVDRGSIRLAVMSGFLTQDRVDRLREKGVAVSFRKPLHPRDLIKFLGI